jgi:NTP pyrophosphatase (non-canonical NTP hydrolase)
MTYVDLALKTEATDFNAIRSRMSDDLIRLDHAAKGMATEVGEFVDGIKKHQFYGKSMDVTNLVEELGDLFWYMAIAADVLGVTFEEIQSKNIAKLKARYGDKFSSTRAMNRNLDTERAILTSDDERK